nr:uncharacterized protein CTRU02_07317 [Colletotrichum truncatum]KAF6791555.1 hypothetical protein CTRU02_07317 [Colletotrichum truncatum]
MHTPYCLSQSSQSSQSLSRALSLSVSLPPSLFSCSRSNERRFQCHSEAARALRHNNQSMRRSQKCYPLSPLYRLHAQVVHQGRAGGDVPSPHGAPSQLAQHPIHQSHITPQDSSTPVPGRLDSCLRACQRVAETRGWMYVRTNHLASVKAWTNHLGQQLARVWASTCVDWGICERNLVQDNLSTALGLRKRYRQGRILLDPAWVP